MKKLLTLLPFLAFFGFICWIIFQADQDQDPLLIQWAHKVPMGDKLGHFLLYGILALLLNQALHFRKISFLRKRVFLGSFLVLSFAILEEFTQLAFPSRTFDFADMAFDFLGIYLISLVFNRIKQSIATK